MPAKAEGYPCTLDTNVDPRAHPTHMVLKKIEITATDFLSKLFNLCGEHVKGADDDRSRNIHRLEEEKKQVACEYLALMAKYERVHDLLVNVREAVEKLRKEKEDMQAELHKLQQEKETSNAEEAALQLKQADTSATGGMSGTHLVDSLQKEHTALRKLNRELTCLVNMYRKVSMPDEPTEEIGETSW